jgi:ubiquitin carboxyl-terminal hydrolase 12/46
MLNELQELFRSIENSKSSSGHFDHRSFIRAVKKCNVLFDNNDHHDSHEFITWLLDSCHEECKKLGQPSFVEDMFGGQLQNDFMCLRCESHATRSEQMNNLSLDIEKNTSLSYCVRRFNFKELLNKQDKFYCDFCRTKQVATKEIQMKTCPKVLLVHFKRFKFDEASYQYQKLVYRIPYPCELRIESLEGPKMYNLTGIVVHVGSGLSFGHYYAFARSKGKWIKFNDTSVQVVEDNEI